MRDAIKVRYKVIRGNWEIEKRLLIIAVLMVIASKYGSNSPSYRFTVDKSSDCSSDNLEAQVVAIHAVTK